MRDFSKSLNHYIVNINSMRKSLPLIMHVGEKYLDHHNQKLKEFIESDHIQVVEEDEDMQKVSISMDKASEFKKLTNEIQSLRTAFEFYPKSVFVSLVGMYDALVGNLIETILTSKTQMLKSLDKQIPIHDLLNAASIEEIKNDIIAKEIESVLRENHLKQLEWFEKKLKLNLHSDQDLIDKFVELTQRRHLFVHADGKVSDQYLKSCRNTVVNTSEKPCLGKKLNISNEYFFESVDVLLEMGIKLTHIIWRKIESDEIEKADEQYNEITYELIYSENYQLAIRLLEFILESRSVSDEYRLIHLINLAQCYKWSGNETECQKLIQNQGNWKIYKERFQMAKHLLLDEYESVYQLLRDYHDDHDVVTKAYIREWPLYQNIRSNEEFIRLFEELYGEPLIVAQNVEDIVIDL